MKADFIAKSLDLHFQIKTSQRLVRSHPFLKTSTVYDCHNQISDLTDHSQKSTLSRAKFSLVHLLFPTPAKEQRRTSQSPISFSIPQTSRVYNAPVLRNIRRSSGRNHRLPSRETTLEGTLSSRKIKGAGTGLMSEVSSWSHALGIDTPPPLHT